MPFEANRKLSAALDNPVPVVLRDYEAMMPAINAYVLELTKVVAAFRSIEIQTAQHDHSETCEACTVIRNVQLRYSHDLSLLAVQARVFGDLHKELSRPNAINHATEENLLTVCLVTRATLDNLVRSCALFMKHDIRVHNKYLAESLTSLQKLVWSTLPQSINEKAIPLLDSYRSLSGSQRNDSDLFADPFPTFARKIEYLKGLSKDEEFNKLFVIISEFYGALSDLVHGGIASLAIANPNKPQIVVGREPLRYTPYTYQVAELAGLSLITTLKTFATLYMPSLIQSLAWMDGTLDITERLMVEHSALAERIKGATF